MDLQRVAREGQQEIDPTLPEIHITDLTAFCTCRRKWDYSSMLRQGRQPSFPPEPLLLGQGVHEALDYGYQESAGTNEPMGFDFLAARNRFDYWLKLREARIIKYTGPLWPQEIELLAGVRELGLAMLKHYSLWSPSRDFRYTLLGTEMTFKMPIPSLLSPVDGHYSPALNYAGRFDGVVRNLYNGRHYVLEFKTTKSISRMSGVFRGMQPTAYIWAASEVYKTPITGVLYRILRKKIPSDPVPLQAAGKFSKAKRQNTSWEWFKYWIEAWAKYHKVTTERVLALNKGVKAMLQEKGNEFFKEQVITRGDGQIQECLRALAYEGAQMANPDTPVYPLSGMHCGWCAFKEPCDLMSLGMPYSALLDAEYAPRGYWEKEDESE